MSKGPEIDAAAARKVADACSEFKLPKASEVSGAGPNSRDWRQRHGLPPAPAAAASVHMLITRPGCLACRPHHLLHRLPLRRMSCGR